MRELKFRAWDKLTNKMFPVGIIDYSIQSVYIEEPNGLYAERDFNEVKLMQFTGLKDKHGEEIYEGDIVRYCDDDNDYKGVVIFDDYYGSFGVKPDKNFTQTFEDIDDYYTELKNLEVIGNKYEHQELLKGE